MKLQTLALRDLENLKGSSVYVINQMNPVGNINLNVSDGMGNTIAVRIPATFIPVDLTTQATKQALISNPHFRRLVAKGAIGLVSEEVALRFLEGKDAAAEHQRLNEMGKIADIGTISSNEVQAVQNENESEIHPVALNVANGGVAGDEEGIRALRTASTSFKDNDWKYVVEMSQSPRIKEFAAEQLNG